MKISERAVLPIARQQYEGYDIRRFKLNDKGKIVGYDAPLMLKTGESVAFEALSSVHAEPTESQAWATFDLLLTTWLKDKQGFILWLDKPHVIRDLKGWRVHCRLAVSEDERFTDAEQFADAPPIPAKFPAMSVEEMLVRK